MSSGNVQVLSVPFYAWDQAQSLQQRAAYLDCLLGSQSSHLATSQVQVLPTTHRAIAWVVPSQKLITKRWHVPCQC